jgi:hypothetical protein
VKGKLIHVPEYNIASFISFPCSDEGNITSEGSLQNIPSPIDLSGFFRYTLDSNAVLRSTIVVSLRDSTLFNRGRRAGGGEERWNPSSMSTKSFG